MEFLTPFLEPLLEMMAGLVFLASLVWSIVHLVRRLKPKAKEASAPLLINLTAGLIVIFVPFTALTTNLDFRLHYSARMAVVADVLAGRYDNQIDNAGARGDLIHLPERLFYLSSGGGDIVRLQEPNRTLILFFSYRGILDSFSGFVYSSDDLPPGKAGFFGNIIESERLRKNWFWIASRN